MNSEVTPHRAVGRQATASADAQSPTPSTARRSLLRAGLTGAAVLGAGVTLGATPAAAGPGTRHRPGTPGEVLRELAVGNRRWSTYRETHPDETPTVRQTLTTSQHPFAVILGCIDSRVPPELVFDQGLGDLLTVRSAGEVLDEAVLGSVAYGVLELGIPLVMVLGHQSCGAVRAAVEADESGARLPAHIQYLADQIRPAIDHGKEGAARVDATVDAHVRAVRARLAAEPDLAAKVTTGQLAIVGARYELTTQRVHHLA
ncbi:carbonic anhydrase [Streptomyces sp. ALI-76-A]|uniref:carbonic anhydrase n=1 Tax=Streptomyces sp. ALI-76-A TaxID=3025736 RepID=UPI00256F4DA0|nr:carbonic anhydrase [Streptomyces sp. ALI-76-A]MDL5199327.1 carbonic anhydrase [Streptomyces sp. ALI-76-A]